jgi:prolyl oligopeptidase
MKRFVVAVPALSLVAAVAWAASPPASRIAPVSETVQGVQIVDPYRWLEGDLSNPKEMGKVTPEVGAWTDAQNAYTRSVLDTLPGRKELEEKLRPLMEVGAVTAPTVRGGRYFYTKREGHQNQPVVYVRESVRGEPRALLDPAQIDPSGLTAVPFFDASEDGKLLLYGTYKAGDENTTLRLLDVDSGKTLPLEIPNKVSSVGWLPDGSGFFYRRLADPKNPYTGEIKLHKMGAEVAQDALFMRQFTKEENEKLATTFGPYAILSRDGRWLELLYYTDTRNNDLWVVDLARYAKDGAIEKTPVLVGEPARSRGPIADGVMYMHTTLGAPNGKVVAVPLATPGREHWREIVPERQDAVIDDVSLGKGVLVVDYLSKASTHLETFALDGKPQGELRLPGIGSASTTASETSSEAFVAFASYNYPSSILRVDLTKPGAEPELWEQPSVPVDPKSVEVKQEWYTSKDGTKVSMFVVHKKGLKLDGQNPTILFGYGGFSVSETPAFSATMFQWYDAGGVYAVANLRGGGEYGEPWHEGGILAHKQNVFDDFIAAGEYLIKAGYTNSKKLAILGGSNGGLLTGATVTQRPDLCAVAIVAVPLLDMLRYQDFLMARYWIPEYGSAENADQFKFLYAYSPYHHVKPGTHYPAVLLTAGENDARVHPSHARKMTASLQAVAAGMPDSKPVLLWVDREAGHGQGKPLNLRIRDTADQRIFIMWQLGMLSPAG